jgi:hypothetical protein
MIARLHNLADYRVVRKSENELKDSLTVGRRVFRHTTRDGVTYKVAGTRDERREAFRLVYESYLGAGLISDNPMRMRVTPYHLYPMTGVFLANHQSDPVYTTSLVIDDEGGLPLEELYPEEVEAMRLQGLRIAEVSCLAGGKNEMFDRKRNFAIFLQLMGLMVQYARQHGVDRLLVAVHPRHAKFYQHFLGFQVFGEQKSYDAVEGNPAVGCLHDFEKTDREGYRYRDQIYATTFAEWELLCQPMCQADQEYFGQALPFTGRQVLPMVA